MERTLTSHTGMGKCIESERCHRRRAGVPANTYKPINTAPFQEFKDFFFFCFITNQWAREMLWMKVFAVKLADLSFEFVPQDLHGERRELLL